MPRSIVEFNIFRENLFAGIPMFRSIFLNYYLWLYVLIFTLTITSCGNRYKEKDYVLRKKIQEIQAVQSISVRDSVYLESGLRLYKIESNDENGRELFFDVTLFENGSIRSLINKDEKGVYKGESYWYYPNGQLEGEGLHANGKREGLWYFYYETGEKRTEAIYESGERYGPCIYFLENGEIMNYELYAGGGNKFYSIKMSDGNSKKIEEGFPFLMITTEEGIFDISEKLIFNFILSRYPGREAYLDINLLKSSLKLLPVSDPYFAEIYPGCYTFEFEVLESGIHQFPIHVLGTDSTGKSITLDSFSYQFEVVDYQ